MDEKILLTGWKLYAYGGVAVALMLMVIFRLDTLLIGRKPRDKRARRQSAGRHPSGRPEFSDPDGRAWKARRRK